MSIGNYPTTPIDLWLRSEQAEELSWEQGDDNWQTIQDALNGLRPLLLKVAAAGGVDYLAFWKSGQIIMMGYSGPDAGWLMCDGSSYATTTHPTLFAAIGYTYGGSGANFNVPDFKGRMPIGAGLGAGLAVRVLGTKYGAEYYTDSRTYSISGITVSGSTPSQNITPTINIPALTIDNTVTATMVNPAISVNSTLAVSPVTASIVNSAITVTNGLSVTSITASITDPSITVNNTLGVSPVLVSIQGTAGGGGDIAISGKSCTNVQILELGSSVMSCVDLTVASTTIAATLSTNVTGGDLSGGVTASITNPAIMVSGGALTGSITAAMTNPTISVSGGVLSGAVTASITNSSITIGGTLVTRAQNITPTINIPAAALSGVTASGSTAANSVNIPTIPPCLTVNFQIKI